MGLTHVDMGYITKKEEMTKNKYVEDACHNENRRKFSQASNTPLMHGRISQDIVFNVTSNSCLKILQGHYNVLPDTDDYNTAYLKYLRIPPNIIEPPQATVPTKYSRRDGQIF